MAFLVDTNVLVYRYDAVFAEKQTRARELLREGMESGQARLAHQTLIEFVSVMTRTRGTTVRLMQMEEALRETEALMNQFPILYPDGALVRTALRGATAYQLSWFDAHMWAYAEQNGISTIYSEDFEHERIYGTVQVINPFV